MTTWAYEHRNSVKSLELGQPLGENIRLASLNADSLDEANLPAVQALSGVLT